MTEDLSWIGEMVESLGLDYVVPHSPHETSPSGFEYSVHWEYQQLHGRSKRFTNLDDVYRYLFLVWSVLSDEESAERDWLRLPKEDGARYLKELEQLAASWNWDDFAEAKQNFDPKLLEGIASGHWIIDPDDLKS